MATALNFSCPLALVKMHLSSSGLFAQGHEKAASNPHDDSGIAIGIPSSGPSSVEVQQSEEEMLIMMEENGGPMRWSEEELLIMMEESGMDPYEMVSVLQLHAGTIIMWVCLVG